VRAHSVAQCSPYFLHTVTNAARNARSNAAMPETTQLPKRRAKPKESPAQSAASEASPEDALHREIASRAYAISQSDSAGSDEENWLRAEHEVRHA
jgi:hypothetical protein